jgi:hypothetical protein
MVYGIGIVRAPSCRHYSKNTSLIKDIYARDIVKQRWSPYICVDCGQWIVGLLVVFCIFHINPGHGAMSDSYTLFDPQKSLQAIIIFHSIFLLHKWNRTLTVKFAEDCKLKMQRMYAWHWKCVHWNKKPLAIMFTPARDFLLETPWRIIIPNSNQQSFPLILITKKGVNLSSCVLAKPNQQLSMIICLRDSYFLSNPKIYLI